ncbi:response regulator [Mesorhizobium sp. KR9-304]|uniref:response regulator n=1 Tax=Mesorhizobium sp. KR9-304 TaxID=3156614 RepID=UPI0032B47B81
MGDTGAVVAIVDDDELVRRALCRLVLSLTYRPVGFSSGEEFLASLGELEPSCAVLDLHMPGLQGLEVLVRVRLRGMNLPVIIITALDQPGMREKCFEAGAAAYLLKPLERSMFSNAIQVAIAG